MAGLCVSPGWIPDETEIRRLQPAFLRSQLYNVDDLDELTDTGVPILLALNNECQQVGPEWQGWDMALERIGRSAAGRVWGIECGNELDKFWHVNEDDCPPSFAANLVKRARPILRKYGIRVIATSVVSPRWPEYLERMADLCREDADYFAFHPYGKRPDGWRQSGWGTGDLSEAVKTAEELAGRPIIITEIGITLESAGGESQVPLYMRAVDDTLKVMSSPTGYSWFAWHDNTGAPDERDSQAFGMVREDGTSRPARLEFQRINTEDTETPMPEPVSDPITELPPMIQAWANLWQAVKPLPYDAAIHDFGIPKYWRAHIKEMGSPVGPEITDSDGTILQAFTLGVFRYQDGTVIRV